MDNYLENAREWLMRTNARLVLAWCIAALVIVSALGGWYLMRPLDMPMPSLPNPFKQKPQLSIGILDMLTAEAVNKTYVAGNNPFLGAPQREVVTLGPVPPPNITSTSPPPPKITKPVAPKKPDTVSLTYRGIFIKSDGKRLALIEDSKSGKKEFYSEGSDLFGVIISNIETGQVEVTTVDGQTVPMTIRKPSVFLEGRNAN